MKHRCMTASLRNSIVNRLEESRHAGATESTCLVRGNLVDKRIVEGAGHFLPREKPEAVVSALLDVLRATR